MREAATLELRVEPDRSPQPGAVWVVGSERGTLGDARGVRLNHGHDALDRLLAHDLGCEQHDGVFRSAACSAAPRLRRMCAAVPAR